VEALSTIGQIALRVGDANLAVAYFRDHELWMVFCKDPDGNQFALMEERR